MRPLWAIITSVGVLSLFVALFIIPYNFYAVSSGELLPLGDSLTVAGNIDQSGFNSISLQLAEYTLPHAFGMTKNTMKIPGWAWAQASLNPDITLYRFPEAWTYFPIEQVKDLYLDTFVEKTSYAMNKVLELAHVDEAATLQVSEVALASGSFMLTLELLRQFGVLHVPAGEIIAGTGEIDKTGKVTPLGGIEAKIRIAEQSGVTTFLYPQDTDISGLTTSMHMIPIEHVDEAVALYAH